MLDFTDRPVGQGLASYLRNVPAGCPVRRVDRDLCERSADRGFYASLGDGAERFPTRGLSFHLMRDDEILCETFAGPVAAGVVEISTCADAIRACEAPGRWPRWNRAKQNRASAAVARKLACRSEREDRLLAWSKGREGTRRAAPRPASSTPRREVPRMEGASTSPEARYATLVEALRDEPGVTHAAAGTSPTKGFGSSALKVHGKIFAMLVKDRLVVKLPRQRVDALIAAGDGARFDPGHGRLMKEWLGVEPASAADWLPLAREAMGFVASKR